MARVKLTAATGDGCNPSREDRPRYPTPDEMWRLPNEFGKRTPAGRLGEHAAEGPEGRRGISRIPVFPAAGSVFLPLTAPFPEKSVL